MGIVGDLQKVVQWVAGLGPKVVSANKELRDSLRLIIGETADELGRGIMLIQLRLHGSKKINHGDELKEYISESPSKIFESFREFQVCRGISDIEDRLKSAFDPMKAAIEIGKIDEVINLIHQIENHEIIVFDLASDVWKELDNKLSQNPDYAWTVEAKDFLAQSIEKLDKTKDKIKSMGREAIYLM
ncbi:hypothetical protein QUF75_02265 [Desulfococcaceae bacterium HSG7]|nr:hypothetical protein [Desulfococcaceae bacterium HSG7]